MTNEELIAALEAADGPSSELFTRAAKHLWGEMPFDGDDFTMPGPDYLESKWPRFLQLLGSEAWESAALMLVPEGWDVDLFIRERFNLARLEHRVLDDEVEGKNAATPALAICIAALKAGGEG